MIDVSSVTFDEQQPTRKLALHALPEDQNYQMPTWMQSRATIPQVVAWIRALPAEARRELLRAFDDERTLRHYGRSSARVIELTDERDRLLRQIKDAEHDLDALRDQQFVDAVAMKRVEQERDRWRAMSEGVLSAVDNLPPTGPVPMLDAQRKRIVELEAEREASAKECRECAVGQAAEVERLRAKLKCSVGVVDPETVRRLDDEAEKKIYALTERVAALEEVNARREFLEREEREFRCGRITKEQFAQQMRERFGFPEVDEP